MAARRRRSPLAAAVLALVLAGLPSCQGATAPQAPPPQVQKAPSAEPDTPRPLALPDRRFAEPTAGSGIDPARRQRLLAALPQVRKALADAVEAKAFPGLAAVVTLGEETVFAEGFGYADLASARRVTPQTAFRIGSISKTVLGVALLYQRDRGALSWDDPVARTVPEVAGVVYPTRDSPRILVRHLLTHTSGIPRVGSLDYARQHGRAPTEPSILAALAGLELEQPPGTHFRYSNLGAAVAGIVLARVGKAPATQLIDETVLGPLGMARTRWDSAAYAPAELATGYVKKADGSFARGAHWRLGAAGPIGGLYSSPEDMARYLIFQLSAWPPRDGPERGIISRSSLRESHHAIGPTIPGQRAHGLFWAVDADATLGHVVGHTGSTALYSSTLWMLPHRRLGLILLANTGNMASRRLTELAHQALATLSAADPEPEPLLSPPLAAAVEAVKALLLRPELDTIHARFAPRFLESVPEDALLSYFERNAMQLGLCGDHKLLQHDSPTSAVVRLYCAQGEMRVTIHVQSAEPHAIVGLVLEAHPQRGPP